MSRQVMSPTLGRSSQDFPRLNGSNFAVWNARVHAALDGQGLLGFIDQADYDGASDSSSDSSESDVLATLKTPVARVKQRRSEATAAPDTASDVSAKTPSPPMSDAPDLAAPNDEAASSEPPSAGSSDEEAKADLSPLARPTNKTTVSESTLPVIRSLAAEKRVAERRRNKLRAQLKTAQAKLRARRARKKRKPSAHRRRRNERKTRSFLIATIDDSHVLLVEACKSAYATYQTLRDRYEGSTAHGDPYYINHYLMTIKYDEGTDLMGFFLEFERALKSAAEATGIVMTDEQKSLCLYHAMPSSWKPDLAIWKGSKKFTPYTDLKTNIERKVLDDFAKRKYIIEKGTPETTTTSNESALRVIENRPDGADGPSRKSRGCTYCERTNHAIRDCRVLQKHLRMGSVKDGTVLPANVAIIEQQSRHDTGQPHRDGCPPAKKPRQSRDNNRSQFNQRSQNRPRSDLTWKAPDVFDHFGNPVNLDDLQRKLQHRPRESGIIAYTADTMAIGLSATGIKPLDTTWTVDSGCTRHAAYQDAWFREKHPLTGTITVGGKKQLPIEGIGNVELRVEDSKGATRTLVLSDVLYVPSMKFNLLSIVQMLKADFHVAFNGPSKCTLFFGKTFKLHAKLASTMDLFQLRATRPDKTPQQAQQALVTAETTESASALVAPTDHV